MSNRRKPTNPTRAVLDALTGQQMPGGCDDCDAYQTVTRQDTGVYVLAVHHDDTCPFYRRITR